MHFIQENDLDLSEWDTSNLETPLEFVEVGRRAAQDKRPNLTLKNLGIPVKFKGGSFNELHLEMAHSGANLLHSDAVVENLTIVDKKGLLSNRVLRDFIVNNTLDVSEMNTENWTSMNRLFDNFPGKRILGLENFNTSNVTDMKGMFREILGNLVTSLDLSNFDTSKVTNMQEMFYDCHATSIDVSNFDTSNVELMDRMFYACRATSLDCSSFNTSKVTDMNRMFMNCHATSIDVSNFDTSKVLRMYMMFYNASKITSLDLSSFTFSGLDFMDPPTWLRDYTIEYMFYGMTNLTQLNVDLDIPAPVALNARNMFTGCSKLQSIDVSKMRNVTYARGMFENCESLTSIVGISEWDVQNFGEYRFQHQVYLAVSFDRMFLNCKSLTNLDLSGWCVWDFPASQPWERGDDDRGKAPTNFATNAPFYENEANRPKWGEYTENCTEPTPTPTPTPLQSPFNLTLTELNGTDATLKLEVTFDPWNSWVSPSIADMILTIDEIDHGPEVGYFDTIAKSQYMIGHGGWNRECEYLYSSEFREALNNNIVNFASENNVTINLSEILLDRDNGNTCANNFNMQLDKNKTYYARFHFMGQHGGSWKIDLPFWSSNSVAFTLTEPTPTPTPISSAGCCPDSTKVVVTQGTADAISVSGVINENTTTFFTYQGFDQGGRLCVDVSTDSASVDEFALTKMVYLNDTTGSPIGTLKKFLSNNQNTVYYTNNIGNCYTGVISNENNIVLTSIDFAFAEDSPTPLPGIEPTPTSNPMDNFSPNIDVDYTEPYPEKDGCLSYENNVGIANDKYYLDGNEEHTGTYNMGIGTYLLKDVPTDHPIFLEFNDESKITIESKTSDAIQGPFGTGYVGDVVITVKGDFGLISYKCANHGYMGGADNLMYVVDCNQTKSNFMVMSDDLKLLPMNLREEHTMEGLVEYIDLEGGFYGIVVYDKQSNEFSNYLPLNLQKELKNEQGKKIKIVSSYSNTDMVSIFMWGTLINVNKYHFIIDDAGCHRDVRPCGNEGEFVVRDPALNCNFPPCFFDLEKFEETYEAWKELELKNYVFNFAWNCYCDDETSKLVTILVVDGKIAGIEDSDGNLVNVDDSFGYYSMTDLFDFVNKEFKKYPHSMTVEYQDGYIKSWFVDRDKMIADEELGFVVSKFVELTEEDAQSEKEYYESDRRR